MENWDRSQVETNLNLAIKCVDYGMPAMKDSIDKTIVDVYNAWSEGQKKIEELEAKISELEVKNNDLEIRLKQLTDNIAADKSTEKKNK